MDKITVRYVAIWKLSGAKTLGASGDSVELARLSDPNVVATVTTKPELFFSHIDRSAGLRALLLKRFFGSEREGTLQEQLALELEGVRARRSEETNKGVFLAIEGETEISMPDFKYRNDSDEFAVCLNAIDKSEIRETFHQASYASLASIVISLPGRADPAVNKVGEVIYLVDPGTDKPIYPFSLQAGSPSVSIASPLKEENLANAQHLFLNVMDDDDLARPLSLLNASLNPAADPLEGFIAAWSALEIFVNVSFKATYEHRWFEIMEDGTPDASKPVFERFKEVMKDKYRLADKFLIIASVLDCAETTTDSEAFRRLKGIRDILLHGLDTPPDLPTEEVQTLLLKYLRLHLGSKA